MLSTKSQKKRDAICPKIVAGAELLGDCALAAIIDNQSDGFDRLLRFGDGDVPGVKIREPGQVRSGQSAAISSVGIGHFLTAAADEGGDEEQKAGKFR